MSKTVVAIFDSIDYAETAARQIKEQGLRTDDISIVAKQRDEAGNGSGAGAGMVMGTGENPSMQQKSKADGGIEASGDRNGMRNNIINDNISDGVISGGVLGGLAGLLIGAGSMVIPGLGIIAAAGPVAGLLSGAVTGGIVGGLVDLGIPESESRRYESDIRGGKVLFSMKTDEDKISRVTSLLRNNGATNVEVH